MTTPEDKVDMYNCRYNIFFASLWLLILSLVIFVYLGHLILWGHTIDYMWYVMLGFQHQWFNVWNLRLDFE